MTTTHATAEAMHANPRAKKRLADALLPALLLSLSFALYAYFPQPTMLPLSVATLNKYVDQDGRLTELGMQAQLPKELIMPILRVRAAYKAKSNNFFPVVQGVTLLFCLLYLIGGANTIRVRAIVSALALYFLLTPFLFSIVV